MDKICKIRYTAENFLKAISYGGELYPLLDGRYVFRGHASEKWKLVPSALREKTFGCMFYDDEHRITSITKKTAPDWECLQIDRELSVLRNFFEKCDKSGLTIPEVERLRITIYSALSIDAINSFEDWLSEDFYELAALAQHYGLPTRLLDWSYSILTALYFAVSGTMTLNESDITPNIVLWALDTRISDPVYHQRNPLVMIRPMYAGNPNLCAQKGLFSFWKVKKGVNPKTGKANIDPTLRAPLDELVSDTVEVGDKPLMYKISIAKDDLPALYQYSKFHHIEASTLFPGYEGVVRNMKENQFFLAQKKREYRIQALT